MAAGRLYVVENNNTMSIVRSISPGKALNHVTQNQYNVRVATADDVAMYMEAGGELEKSKEILDLEATGSDEEQPVQGEGTPDGEADTTQ